ncbi:MAG: hypothetical protein ACREM9_14655 [Gemmatimonadales bacterium]
MTAVVAVVVLCWSAAQGVAQATPTRIQLDSGVTPTGHASEQWLTMIRKRLPRERYDSIAPLRRPLTVEEAAWDSLIRSRVAGWESMVPALASLFAPAPPPAEVFIVVGNRGAEDAFTHDGRTIGYDLAALQANYGTARKPENRDRMDRFFRHEFVHLLQKAWWPEHPWPMDTPLRAALAEIWAEGLGNHYSRSERWLSKGGRRSPAATAALADLEPRFVARLSALACATPEAAEPLLADLSWGRFDRKWGALPAALWLEAEPGSTAEALRRFIVAGPAGVWELANRHLPVPLRSVLREARTADSLCAPT